MLLIETYANACSLKIDKPTVNPLYFPVPFKKYATIHTSSGMDSKNYGYWQQVFDFINPYFEKNGIKIIQIGGKDDVRIKGAIDLCGQTSLRQTFYLIQNTEIHIGNDSFPVHLASSYNKKIVALYSILSYKNCGPAWGDSKNQVLIESHRNGLKPTFSNQEHPKTINLIKPEQVIIGVEKLMNFGMNCIPDSIHFGESFNHNQVFEFVADHMFSINMTNQDPNGADYNIRMDYPNSQEEILYKNLRRDKKYCIVTRKPMNLDILSQIPQNIVNFVYIFDKNYDIGFVEKLQKSKLRYTLHCEEKESDFNDNKLDFIEYANISYLTSFKKEDIKDKEKISENSLFKTNKLIISNNKFYPSITHLKNGVENKDENQVIEGDDFYRDAPFFMIYNKNVI